MKTKLLIFGITGDLSTRKLLPALRNIVASHPDLEIIGASRRDVDEAELVGVELAERTRMFTMDLAEAEDYRRLKEYVALDMSEQLLVYLSVPPQAATQIVEYMGQAGINGANVKILFEKPFGIDEASAQEMIGSTAKYYDETQLYRIDHYAAKEIAVELVRLRQNAESHHHSWSGESIEAIEVLATETIGVEGRAVFYEQTGALRDFVQGHLIQLLALVLMDVGESDVPTARLKALAHLRAANPAKTTRSQYEGYDEEVENPGSLVETFVRVQLTSDDPRWQDTKLTLLTGKALDAKRSQVVIHYKDGTQEIFDEDQVRAAAEGSLDAYERVLIEAIQGNKTLFTTSGEVLESWRVLAPLQDAWNMDETPLYLYKQGSSPSAIR